LYISTEVIGFSNVLRQQHIIQWSYK